MQKRGAHRKRIRPPSRAGQREGGRGEGGVQNVIEGEGEELKGGVGVCAPAREPNPKGLDAKHELGCCEEGEDEQDLGGGVRLWGGRLWRVSHYPWNKMSFRIGK
jgi:hypothetical protein